jgi:hypothetical protein
MSTEFHFAVSSKPVPKRTAVKRHRIAREVGGPHCGYTTYSGPDNWPRAWAYGPNRGFPFDDKMAAAVLNAWTAAGVGI